MFFRRGFKGCSRFAGRELLGFAKNSPDAVFRGGVCFCGCGFSHAAVIAKPIGLARTIAAKAWSLKEKKLLFRRRMGAVVNLFEMGDGDLGVDAGGVEPGVTE